MNTLGRTLTVAMIAAAAGGGAAYALTSGAVDLGHLGEPRNVVDVYGETVGLPVPDTDPQRLAPVVVTDAEGEFAWQTQGVDGPVLHDPCRAIHWQLSTPGMPAGVEEIAKAAVEDISTHTGLVFIYDGLTGSAASFEGPLVVHRETWEYAPMVIGWASGEDLPDLGGDTTGVGGSRISPGAYGDREYLRSGTVILDTSDMGDGLTSDIDATRLMAVLLHELGHVVGLDHVLDANELMFPAEIGATQWGPGDLEGLALAGAGPCEAA